MILQVHKRSEKVIIWMHRNKITGADIAREAKITRATFNQQLHKDSFSDDVLSVMKLKGFKE